MNELRTKIDSLLREIPIDFGGGCSVSKAYLLAYLIRRFSMRVSLDIGVYRGRSLFPQALAHKDYAGGLVYGVDPWSAEIARENDNLELKQQIDKFLDKTDFEAIYQGVVAFKKLREFDKHCILVRQTSEAAAGFFSKENILFDLIHVDGNHDTEIVMKDIELFLLRLRPGGFLVLDDISWDSVKPAYSFVATRFSRVFQRVDPCNDYAVFWNTSSKAKTAWLRMMLKFVGRG